MGIFGSRASAVPTTAEAAAYQPSALDIGLNMLFGHGSPAEVAEQLRQQKYAEAMRPIQAQAMQSWMGRFGGGQSPQGAPADPAAMQPVAPAPAPVDPSDLQGVMTAGLGRAVDTAVPQLQPAAARQAPAPIVPQAGARRRNVVDINNPDDQSLIIGGKMFGMPGADAVMDVAKATQPDIQYDRGFGYDKKTGQRAGSFHPDLDKGQEPLYDAQGNVVAIRNMDGSVQAAAQMAGAVAGAQEGAKAGWDVGTYNNPDGSTTQMPRAAFVRGFNGQGGGPIVAQAGGQPGSLPPGLGRSQTPQARAAAETTGRVEADAGARARIDLPAVQQRAATSVSTIDDLLKDPHLGDALGWNSKLPAIPKSHRVAVEAKLDQLSGTTFLQAYNELKGAGAITEVEGAKAEAAIARLKRRDMGLEDYQAALKDLRDVITGGVSRAQTRGGMGGGGGQQAQARSAPKVGDVQQGYRFNGGNPADPKSWSRI